MNDDTAAAGVAHTAELIAPYGGALVGLLVPREELDSIRVEPGRLQSIQFRPGVAGEPPNG